MSKPSPPLRGTVEQIDVLIVGAGPTGLTLACELARAGVPALVVEASPSPQPGSRGKGLQPRTLEAFDDLGIVKRVLATGRTDLAILSTDAEGLETTRPTAAASSPDVPYPATVIIPQWRVEEALRDRLHALGGHISFRTELVSFRDEDDRVVAKLIQADGPTTIEAEWLVGCDGGHSTVRRQAGIGFVGRTDEDVRMIVADVRAAGLDRDHWRMWRHPEGFFALCPLPSTDHFQVQASIAPGQDPALTLANMRALLERRTGRPDIRLSEPSWSSVWRANVRSVDRFRQGRILLAGDAAHIHSPAGGQGMNTGIQDARNLGWKLAAVTKGGRPGLLDTYDEERLPVAASVLELSDAMLKQAVAARGIAVTPDARTNQLGINYRGSSLAREEGDGSATLRAGDRAPDASGLVGPEGACRLFDLLRGDHFTMLIFGGGAPQTKFLERSRAFSVRVRRIADHVDGSLDLVDAQGHLSAAYAPTGEAAILIRPDGYIGLVAVGNGIAAAERYLSDLVAG